MSCFEGPERKDLLRLQVLAALARRSAAEALRCAKEICGQVDLEGEDLWRLEAQCLASVSYGVSGRFEESIEAAEKLAEMAKGEKRSSDWTSDSSDWECFGELLIASGFLARQRALDCSVLRALRSRVHLEELKRAHVAAQRAFGMSSVRSSLRAASLQRLSEVLSLQGEEKEAR